MLWIYVAYIEWEKLPLLKVEVRLQGDNQQLEPFSLSKRCLAYPLSHVATMKQSAARILKLYYKRKNGNAEE